MTRVPPPASTVVVVTDRMVPLPRSVVPGGRCGHAFELIVKVTGDVSIFGWAPAEDALKPIEIRPSAPSAVTSRFMCSTPSACQVGRRRSDRNARRGSAQPPLGAGRRQDPLRGVERLH